MAESNIKALRFELEDMAEMCDRLNYFREEIKSHCEASQKELDALTQEMSALNPDDKHFAQISARLAEMTTASQRCEMELSEVQAKLEECQHAKRELQQRIDDMSAAP